MIKTRLAVFGAVLFALSAVPGLAQAFRDLPGVTPADPLGQADHVVCEQVITKMSALEPTRGPRYVTLNACSRNGGPTFTSPRLPPSIERQLRGFNY